MKNLLAAAVFLVTSVVAFAAQTERQTERQIASIRSEVSLINRSAGKYQKKSRNVEGISLEGTEATYFISGRGLKKITAKVYGETFRATAEFYYSGEEPIFAYRRVERYDTHIAMTPPPKVVKVTETRVYYSGGRAVRVIDGKRQLAAADARFLDADTEMRELSAKLKAALDR